MNATHVSQALKTFRQLPDCAPFRHLRNLPSNELTLDSCDAENDTLFIGYYAIQQVETVVPTIAGPRKAAEFAVSETRVTLGGYSEPDDADLCEFTRVPTFAAALVAIAARETELYVENIVTSDAMAGELAREVEEV